MKTPPFRRIRLTSPTTGSRFSEELEHSGRNRVVAGCITERVWAHGQVMADEPGRKTFVPAGIQHFLRNIHANNVQTGLVE